MRQSHGRTHAKRMERLLDFSMPARREVPLTKPEILLRPGFVAYNKRHAYAQQIKPFGFIQAATPALMGKEPIQPIAPYERSLRASKRLPWIDLHTGRALSHRLDQPRPCAHPPDHHASHVHRAVSPAPGEQGGWP